MKLMSYEIENVVP